MLKQKQQQQRSRKYKRNRTMVVAPREKWPVNYALTYNVLPTTPSGQISGVPNRSIRHCIFKINAWSISMTFGITTKIQNYYGLLYYYYFAFGIVPLQFDCSCSLVKRHSIWLGLAPTLLLYFIYKHYLDGIYSCNWCFKPMQIIFESFLHHRPLQTVQANLWFSAWDEK